MRDKIRELLGRGLSNVIVANAVGCSESYISQLMAEPAFAEEVSQLKLQFVTKDTERHDKVDKIRDQLLDRLEKSAAFAYKPGEVLTAAKALQTLAGTISGNERAAGQQVQSQVVQVVMPAVIAANFTRNSHNEIIEVEGRSLATLTPAALKAISSTPQQGVQNDKITQSDSSRALAVAQHATTVDKLEAEAA